jgi:hypothetical protein
VYILCALTSLACCALLLRGYARNGMRLLLWSGLCFGFFTVENVVLFVDLVLTPPEVSLLLYRRGAALIGLLLLIYGLVWDSK